MLLINQVKFEKVFKSFEVCKFVWLEMISRYKQSEYLFSLKAPEDMQIKQKSASERRSQSLMRRNRDQLGYEMLPRSR